MTPLSVRRQALVQLARLSRRAPAFRGRTRLQRLVQRALAPRGRAPADVDLDIDGVVWSLDLNELVQSRLFWDGAHDGHVLAWLEREARRRTAPVVWDVGANVGSIALPLARRTGAEVHAFEPSPAIYARLEANVRANLRLGVRAHQIGLADRDGTMPFYPSAESGNAGVGSLGRAHNTTTEPVDVRVARGDTLVAAGEVPRPDIVKIDVEGFEPEALMGLATTLQQHRPVLCVESSAYRLDGRGLPRAAIVDTLEALGYRVRVIEAGGERLLQAPDLATNFDLAASPV